jgi:dynein heavy chain
LKKAILGEILMAEEIEDAMIAMCDGQIPAMWIKAGFNSLKPLASYIKDLQIRLEFFQTWIENGIPEVFWINKFFFTHGFLTGALQNYARKYKIAIDTLAFDQYVIHDAPADGAGIKKPEDGLYCIGMILEGAKWCPERRYLDESDPKILYTACPMVHFMPKKNNEVQIEGVYPCPLFKTPDRLGVLMTTGHSTNYVCDIRLPTEVPNKHWIMRGTAMLLSLSE